MVFLACWGVGVEYQVCFALACFIVVESAPHTRKMMVAMLLMLHMTMN